MILGVSMLPSHAGSGKVVFQAYGRQIFMARHVIFSQVITCTAVCMLQSSRCMSFKQEIERGLVNVKEKSCMTTEGF